MAQQIHAAFLIFRLVSIVAHMFDIMRSECVLYLHVNTLHYQYRANHIDELGLDDSGVEHRADHVSLPYIIILFGFLSTFHLLVCFFDFG